MNLNDLAALSLPRERPPSEEAWAVQILERISDAFISLDTQWRCTYLNSQAAKLLGRPIRDIVGKTYWDEFPEDVGSAFYQAAFQALAGQAPLQIEEYFVPTERWFETRLYPAPDGLSVFFQDITARKQAAARQKQLEEEQRTTLTLQQAILDSAHYAIFSMTEDGTITTFNAGAERMLGYPAAEVVGRKSVAHFHDPAEVTAHGGAPGAVHEALFAPARAGEAAETEWTLIRRDGTRFPVMLSVMPLRDAAGAITGFLAIGRDISERKQAEAARRLAEENYRALFMNAVGGIFQTSPQGRYLQVNPALAHIYGYETPAQMIGELTDVSRQLYVQDARRAEFERLMCHQGFVSHFESQVRRRDGSLIWISESARPVWDASGRLLRYEGFVEDITDRKVMEAQQAHALREAIEQADRDPLTGLLNHRAFHARLAQETARTQRDDTVLAVVMLDLDNFKFFNDVHGHTTGDSVLRLVADRLRDVCRPYDTLARFGGDEFALILPGIHLGSTADLEERLRADLGDLTFRPDGTEVEIPIGVSVGVSLYTEPDAGCRNADRQELVERADERLRRTKTGGAATVVEGHAATLNAVKGFSMLDALVTAVDNKDRYTRRHSEDVLAYSLQIAQGMGLDEHALRLVAVAALLHDVGKIGVPDHILRKPGLLTDDEFQAVQQHPQMGAAIIGAVPGLEETLDAVRHHHERWDGQGYPFGLTGEETPLIARLMAVADAYSAMTTDRPYRKGMAPDKARAILEAGAGTQWDPACVRAFLQTQGVLKAA